MPCVPSRENGVLGLTILSWLTGAGDDNITSGELILSGGSPARSSSEFVAGGFELRSDSWESIECVFVTFGSEGSGGQETNCENL